MEFELLILLCGPHIQLLTEADPAIYRADKAFKLFKAENILIYPEIRSSTDMNFFMYFTLYFEPLPF